MGLTVLLTSPRVAPGLLSWDAWAALRGASRVLASPADHPQLAALSSAGIEASPGSLDDALAAVAAPDSDSASASAEGERFAEGKRSAEGERVVWLAPPDSPPPSLPSGARVLRACGDLPGARLLDAVAVMDTLRVSCPWDRKQTHSSLLRYLLEEAYEAAEAIELADMRSLREELGDVLLQVLFHARVASERPAGDGGFSIDDVADGLAAKLRRRHPHVFGSVSVSSAEDVNRNWEAIKRAERASAPGAGPVSALDGVPFGQPALSLAAQLQRRAGRAGFSSPDVSSPEAGSGVGDELMAVVARAREAGADPELELREAARRFAGRFREWERLRVNRGE
jgi:XTP/dITP diphosphohydrolase